MIDTDSLPEIPKEITVNEVRMSGDSLIAYLQMLTNPDPNRWYRFERQGDIVTVHVKYEEAA